jgi:DNA-binding response OmpR family regulator
MTHARILVVEDDPDIMHILKHSLSSAGYQVIPAYGNKQLIAEVEEHFKSRTA